MSKTLSNLLTIFKVAKVLAKIAFILCIHKARQNGILVASVSALRNADKSRILLRKRDYGLKE